MRRAILVGLVAVFCLAMAVTSPAWAADTIGEPPYETADSCLACHAVRNDGPVVNQVDFDVAPVDRSACDKCHWLSLHPGHGAGDDCAECHYSWPTTGDGMPWVSSVETLFGWFDSASSAVMTDAATLHAIHGKRGWPADVTSRRWGCGSCHAPAACTACHTDVPHDPHPLQNGSPAPAAPYAATAPGAPVDATSFLALDTFGYVSCAAGDCHRGIGSERITEDSAASVSTEGTWTVKTPATTTLKLLGGSALYTTATASSVTVPFEGNQVSVWGYTGYNAGAIEVYVDGVFVAKKQLWETGIHPANGIWTSKPGLGSGSHTLRIVTAKGVNGGTTIYFDRIVARDVVAATDTAPNCLTCHPARVSEHGYEAFDHVADEAALLDPALGKACGDCHSMDLSTAHATVGACEVCHVPVSADSTLTAEGTINPDHRPGRWAQTCEACHNAANPVLRADKHDALYRHDVSTVVNDQPCLRCHKGDLPGIHASAATTVTVSGVATGLAGCDVCHKNPTLAKPLTNDCTVCHDPSAGHPNVYRTPYYGRR